MNRITIKQNELPYDVEEEIKSLRTSLQFFREDKKVIMISSCISGEGKSSTIYNLAVSLASLNKKVLLVDADVRKGKSVIHITEGKAGKGLTHYLSGQTSLVDIVNATNIPNLHVIFSGPVPPDSTELLSGKAFEKMITTMRGVYDYILIDTSPVGMVVDAAIIGEQCDGALLMIEAGKIKYRFAQEAKKKLENSGCPIMGVILNKVDYRKGNKYYGKYYGRYYGHYGSPYGGEKKS